MSIEENVQRVFENFPTLQSQRFLLRRPKMEDAKQLYALAHNEKISRYTFWQPHRSVGESLAVIEKFRREYENHKTITWFAESKTAHEFVGLIEVRNISLQNKSIELGFWLGEEFWGHEYMVEILRSVITFCCVSLNLVRVEGSHVAENEASGRVLTKAGMVCEGKLRKGKWFKGRGWDVLVYSILSNEVLPMSKESSG
ncbi:MAG: GNAT family N-acetyltransferase [Peptococcaceae bacterium]|nr:GNAT family N-acetyltransferase [Peptococcaceae bacterium]